jgi:hypothetical protein
MGGSSISRWVPLSGIVPDRARLVSDSSFLLVVGSTMATAVLVAALWAWVLVVSVVLVVRPQTAGGPGRAPPAPAP